MPQSQQSLAKKYRIENLHELKLHRKQNKKKITVLIPDYVAAN